MKLYTQDLLPQLSDQVKIWVTSLQQFVGYSFIDLYDMEVGASSVPTIIFSL